MNIEELYEEWVNFKDLPLDLKEELENMTETQKEDAFFKDIDFGTAGMRGILGAGTNRINIFTVRRATVGFGKYLLDKFPDAKERGVVISHDNRYKSREFTLDTAATLNRMGINTYIFDGLRPTPELSYAVRKLNCVGGVMITASHNPKEYNGYKVYDENGCQLVPEKISGLISEIKKLPSFLKLDITKYRENARNTVLDNSIDDAYIEDIKSIQINRDLSKKDFKIVFSPEHGTGSKLGMRLLVELGYDVYPVVSQLDPLPGFDHTASPNPEEKGAYEEALKVAKEVEADLIVVTDPDADRLGVGFLSSYGNYELLTGNESSTMLLNYLLNERRKRGFLSENSVVYSTIVSSALGGSIARKYNVKFDTFLTGFKFIGNQIALDQEQMNGPHFEFGYEESYGCLIGDFVRDKDALQALEMYTEMANYYKKNNLYLDDVQALIAKEHGYYADITKSILFEGAEGAVAMNNMLTKLRKNYPKKVGDLKVKVVEDYEKGLRFAGSKTQNLTLPQSDVIKLFLENGDTITIRPSGTEPKCKFYYGVKSLVSKEKAYKTANEYHLLMLEIIH
jgi:phosphoglucomutase